MISALLETRKAIVESWGFDTTIGWIWLFIRWIRSGKKTKPTRAPKTKAAKGKAKVSDSWWHKGWGKQSDY